jgi:hypothetical protein
MTTQSELSSPSKSGSVAKPNANGSPDARAQAAATELAELFRDETCEAAAHPEVPEVPASGHVQKIVRESEMRQQRLGEPISEGKKKFSSPKDFELYGCDDMSPPPEADNTGEVHLFSDISLVFLG